MKDMNDLKAILFNKHYVVESLDVATMINKRHADLLRDIESYKNIIDQNAKLRSDDFFLKSEYEAGTGKKYKMFYLTKKGCDMVANKMTGEKGVLFTATYVTEFERMKNEPRALTEMEQLKASMRLSLETSEEISKVKDKVSTLEQRFDNELTLTHGESSKINHLIKKRVETLWSSGTHGTMESKPQMYSNIHGHLRRAFNAPTYREIKRVDFEDAAAWIKTWRPL